MRGERRFGGSDDRIGIEAADDADDDVGAGVLAADVVEQVGAADVLDRQAAADHRLGDRMAAVREPVEQLVGGRQHVFLVLGQLVQDHLALALELGLGEAAVADDVAEHRDEARRVGGQAAHVIRGVVLVGVRVDVGAEPLGVEVDLLAAARVRSLERHVLDEMADAVQAPALVAAAGSNEDADVDALQVRQGDRDDANAVAEADDGRLGVVAFAFTALSIAAIIATASSSIARDSVQAKREALVRGVGDVGLVAAEGDGGGHDHPLVHQVRDELQGIGAEPACLDGEHQLAGLVAARDAVEADRPFDPARRASALPS